MSKKRVEHDDNPEWTAVDFARAKGPESLRRTSWRHSRTRRSAVGRSRTPKEAVSLRLDAQVVNHLRSRGPGWQTRVNDTLAEAIREGRL